MLRKILFLSFLMLSVCVQAQLKIETRAGVLGSTGETPFHLRANKYGVVPTSGASLYLTGDLTQDYDSTRKGVNFGFGLTPHVNIGEQSAFLLPQAYAKARWKSLEVYVGRRKEVVGLMDTLLTSGSYIWSGNALPLWKIQAGIPEYTPLTRGRWIYVKGAMAHGWFENERPVTRNVKLHQKWMYVRLGKPQWKAKVHAGFNHQVQWGGESPFYSVDGKLPDGLSNFKYVFLGTRHPNISGPVSNFDGENRIGNHLGTADIGLELTMDFGSVLLYRQNIYEDGSLYFLTNITDGLNGLTFTFPKGNWISRFNVEYLSTMSQGGNVFVIEKDAPGQLRGADNYFNHGQYRDGWTSYGRTIGTPFIQSIYRKWTDPEYQIDNNRVSMFQWAFSGKLPLDMQYILKGNHSTNRGSYQFPLPTMNQSSFLLSLQKMVTPSSSIRLEAGLDKGTLLPNSTGINVVYARKW